jgi:hypothetical protein
LLGTHNLFRGRASNALGRLLFALHHKDLDGINKKNKKTKKSAEKKMMMIEKNQEIRQSSGNSETIWLRPGLLIPYLRHLSGG